MRRSVSSILVFSLAVATLPMQLSAQEINPNYSISAVGPDSLQGPIGAVLADRFTVRIVDRDGRPVPDIVVWFYPNCTIRPPEDPVVPCAQGSFVGIAPDQLVTATTDQNGTAVAPPYKVDGSIDIVAGAYDWNDGSANDVIGWPPLVEFFHVNHRAGEPPDSGNPVVTPNGTPTPFAAPALSSWGLIALTILVLGIGAARRKFVR